MKATGTQHLKSYSAESAQSKREAVGAARFCFGCLVTIFLCTGNVSAQNGSVPVVQNPEQVFPTPNYGGDFWDRSTLTGDWGGARQELANKGVTLDAELTQVTQGVVQGGIKSGWEYMGRGQTTLNLDTAKMGWWPGGLFTVIGEGNFGTPLTKNTGSLLGTNANELFPELENSFVLPQVTYTQFFSPEIGIALGKFATIGATAGDMNDFAHGKGSHQFMNTSLSFNPVMAITVPYSTLGASLLISPTKDWTVSLGVVNPQGVPESAGLDKLFENGASFVAETRFTTRFCGLKGHQLIGGSYSTSDYAELDQRAANFVIPGLPVGESDQSWSYYLNVDQYLYQPDPEKDRGIGIFARYGKSDGIANPLEYFASVGVGGKGMIPERENDGFGLGYSYFWVADAQVVERLGFEDAQGMEAYYEIALTPSVYLTPDVQWIEPSQGRVDSSWVTGMRLYTAF